MIVLFFTFFVLASLVVLLWTKESQLHNQLQEWYSVFIENGFDVSQEFKDYRISRESSSPIKRAITVPISEWSISKGGYRFKILTMHDIPKYRDFIIIEFSFHQGIQNTIDLTITKRNDQDRLSNRNAETHPELVDKYFIRCSNDFLVKELISVPEYMANLNRIMDHTEALRTKETNVVRALPDATEISKVCDFIITFISIIEKIYKIYTERILEITRARLISMESGERICIICRGTIEDSSELVIMPCCETIVHEPHIRLWLMKSRRCPNCRKEASYMKLALN
ncbi:MAG: RING-H2 finger protein [Methanobacteriota archaeon]|nr:MAG: RING-H2 finger protein [Euryarchaeota archaeon]